MTVVNFTQLQQHASGQNYNLPVVRAFSLPVARGVMDCANKLDAPVVLAVTGDELQDGLLPSVEAMARQARVPVALLAVGIENTEQTIQAIRAGCQGVVPGDGLTQAVSDEIHRIAGSCGIAVMEQYPAALVAVDKELEKVTLQAVGRAPSSWQQFHELIAQAAADEMQECFANLAAAGQGRAALDACEPWRPVEHLIIYNTTTDDDSAAEIAAEGRRVLDRIPGVRATWSGRAVQPDARFQWCWLIRFADKAVIDSYREHPDHVAYADNHFRPIAGDRISIDYELS